jgi:hypothetical protein
MDTGSKTCRGEYRGLVDGVVDSCGGESRGGGGTCSRVENVDGSIDEIDVVGS